MDELIEVLKFDNIIELANVEGYHYAKGQAIFGTKLGPTISLVDGGLHEISHAIEVQSLDRLLKHNFGLEIKTKVVLFGKEYWEPKTWNATKLECRVILWQDVLCKRFGYEFDPKEFAKSLQYMSDFTMVPIFGCHFDYDRNEYIIDGTNEIFDSKLDNRDSLRYQSIYAYMDDQKKLGIYTFPNFLKHWNKVLEFLHKNKL